MEFKLYYRGPLKSNRGPTEKQAIRRIFHPQLKKLWAQEPLIDYASGETNLFVETPKLGLPSIIYPVSDFKFACLINERLKVHAELDILFLRPEPSGRIIKTGGDIDNRLKTLFDGLRRPLDTNEIPNGDTPQSDEAPFHCLLSDDALITKITVATDQLLDTNLDDEIVLVIHVRIKGRATTFSNIGLIS
jgi:hypothetical protein